MEDKAPGKEKKKEDINDEIKNRIEDLIELKKKSKIPNFPINKKIQKKILKELYKKPHINKDNKKREQIVDEKEKKIIKKIIYPSGIKKTITKNEKNKIINEDIDYKDLNINYINNIKENLDKELVKLIENSFLLYNRRQIIKNIVKNPYSTKLLEEKILLWKYYVKNLTKDEKALLIRKLLYFIGRFSEKIHEEFLQVKEIFQAYNLYLLKGKINKGYKANNSDFIDFYMFSPLLGYDEDGKPDKNRDLAIYLKWNWLWFRFFERIRRNC